MSARAVSFDFGQTIAGIDSRMLARKLDGFGFRVREERLDASLAGAWRAYDAGIRAGHGGHPWKLFMRSLLEAAIRGEMDQPPEGMLERAVDWLWTEQPKENLWRKPIPGMLELCADSRDRNIPFGVLSNSEGHLAELISEMGHSRLLDVVGDSGRLGIEKPDRRMFEWIAKELGVEPESIVHVGDSLEADVEGAIAAGMYAIWFSPKGGAGRAEPSKLTNPLKARICGDADEVRSVLVEFGIAL